MIAATTVLWGCAFLAFYVWFGYPVLLWALSRATASRGRTCSETETSALPSVTVIVAVHNEQTAIAGRLENCLGLSYPQGKLEVMVASDGSTDGTVRVANEFAQKHPNVSVVAQTDRLGKTAAQNAAVQRAKNDIVVFSDVDTKFDGHFLDRIMRPFADGSVGCVTGALVWMNPDETAVAEGGDLYWRYEHFLWRLESALGLLAWASGACLAVRRELCRPMDSQYGEDCIVPLDVVSSGFRVVFQPDAIAREVRIADPRAEMRARVRMTLRGFAGTLSQKHLLNPLRSRGIAWSIMSHKILRWITPYFLFLGFVSNLLLLHQPAYRFVFALQILFYISAVIGYVLDRCHVRLSVISVIYAFCLMNLGISLGVAKAVLGHRILAYRSEG